MHTVLSEEEMAKEAAGFVAGLSPRERATVVAISGELGAGKTTFVKGIAKALGVTEHVTSPTFVILKIYDLQGQKYDRLIHMDAYRLKGEAHLKVLGWEGFVKDPKNLILVEWPEKIAGAIPEGAVKLSLEYSDEGRNLIYG